MQKPRLTIFRVAVMADSTARRQIPAPQSSKSESHMRSTLSRSAFITLSPSLDFLPSGITISRSQCPDWLVHRRTGKRLEATSLPSTLVQTPVELSSGYRDAWRQRSTSTHKQGELLLGEYWTVVDP
ncbi:hypothetical protein K443DRAFT_564215 [Laccaria amethystina LaAM-08-1]|uniref:Uncharacterized protein n=1 Tax=Laccaria amethystina LaAM-08-1 TaxID=1095629 RepID=A0A0C9X995_9AGAR|nr:hypothetical protein K443DRAFT_564215 [Laccaria amethystina LaAM-08-1]